MFGGGLSIGKIVQIRNVSQQYPVRISVRISERIYKRIYERIYDWTKRIYDQTYLRTKNTVERIYESKIRPNVFSYLRIERNSNVWRLFYTAIANYNIWSAFIPYLYSNIAYTNQIMAKSFCIFFREREKETDFSWIQLNNKSLCSHRNKAKKSVLYWMDGKLGAILVL